MEDAFDSCPFYVGWAMASARSGFHRVMMGHKLAASLMATHADDVEAMTCSPWDAYPIEVPPEVVRVTVGGQSGSFDVVGVWHPARRDERSFVVLSRDAPAIITGELTFPLPDLGDFTQGAFERQDHDVLSRVRESMARLILGTELEMKPTSHTTLGARIAMGASPTLSLACGGTRPAFRGGRPLLCIAGLRSAATGVIRTRQLSLAAPRVASIASSPPLLVDSLRAHLTSNGTSERFSSPRMP